MNNIKLFEGWRELEIKKMSDKLSKTKKILKDIYDDAQTDNENNFDDYFDENGDKILIKIFEIWKNK